MKRKREGKNTIKVTIVLSHFRDFFIAFSPSRFLSCYRIFEQIYGIFARGFKGEHPIDSIVRNQSS